MIVATWLMFIPPLIQALLMLFDEFYFHRKRGLGKWEAIGHPLDTLTVIAPFFYACTHDFNDISASSYVLMAIFSCIFIVKDEFIHKEICSRAEMILHALLFIVHPLVFLSIFLFWQNGMGVITGISIPWKTLILGQLSLSIAFLFYQVSYWSFVHGSRSKQRNL
jgi:hypothetical protein